jgi:transcriptional regulator with XRE-family HTH domain
MLANLKLQIFRRGNRQYQLAQAVGIDETVLSKIIHGYRNPTLEQRRLLSAYLEADEEWLFECFEVGRIPFAPQAAETSNEKKAGGDGDA